MTPDERNALRRIDTLLIDLASSATLLENQQTRQEYYFRLEDIYRDDFRHLYSQIFATLAAIHNKEIKGDLEYLQTNLRFLYENYTAQEEDVSKHITKLYDHVSLEIARMRYSDGGDAELRSEERYVMLEAKLKEVEGNIKRANTRQKSLKEKLDSFNAQSVTILGIFAGLAIGFSTSADLLVKSLSQLSEISVIDMVIYLSAVGLVIFNVIFLLLYCVARISGRSIARKSSDNTTFELKYPLVFWYDIISLFLLIALLIVKYEFGL